VVYIYIFGVFRLILKQICLFQLFQCTFSVCFGSFWNKTVCFGCFKIHLKHQNKPKQDYHWFRKWTETNAKQILFRLFAVRTEFFIFVSCTLFLQLWEFRALLWHNHSGVMTFTWYCKQWCKHRRVATLRCPKHPGVLIFQESEALRSWTPYVSEAPRSRFAVFSKLQVLATTLKAIIIHKTVLLYQSTYNTQHLFSFWQILIAQVFLIFDIPFEYLRKN